MINNIAELNFIIFDYAFLIITFVILRDKKFEIFKFLLTIAIAIFIRYLSDYLMISPHLTFIKNMVISVCMLSVYDKEYSKMSFLNALMVNGLFVMCSTFYITIAQLCSFNILNMVDISLNYLVISIALKLIIVTTVLYLILLLKKLKFLVNNRIYLVLLICSIICEVFMSSVLELTDYNNTRIIMVTSICIMILYFTITFNYYFVKKKNNDFYLLQQSMDLVDTQIIESSKEKNQIKELMHETKNYFFEIDVLLDNKDFSKIKTLIQQWELNFSSGNITTVCSNIYLDTILRQKIEYYPDINYQIQVQVPEIIMLHTYDLLALLSVLLNSICTYAKGKDLTITINADNKGILINIKLNSDSHKDILKRSCPEYIFIKSIVDKYSGEFSVDKGNNFNCSIMIFYQR